MNFYFVFFACVLFLCLFSQLGTRRISTSVIIRDPCYYIGEIYVFLALFLISALRYEVGTDYLSYQEYAKNEILGYSIWQAMHNGTEPFFVLFTKLSYFLCGNMQIFYAIVAFFISYFLIKGILFYEKNLFFPISLFFITTSFFISFNAMRQMAAFSVFLYANRFILTKEFKKYLLCILLAMCWHTSAVAYLLCYFFPRIRIQKSFLPIVLGMFFAKKTINLLLMFFLEKKGLGLAYYFFVQEGTSSKSFIVISFCISFCFWLFCKRDTEKIRNFLFNCSISLVLISILGDGIPGSYRLVYLFWPMTTIICPYVYKKSGCFRLFIFILFLFLFSFFFWKNQIIANTHDVVPYRSIWR